MQSRLLLSLAIVDVGLFGGVGAQEVMEDESARDVLLHEIRPGQLGQRRSHPLRREPR